MHISLTWRILFSLTFMSHLYKEFSCESIVHKTEKELEQTAEKHLPEIITEDKEQQRLLRLGLHQGAFSKVFNTDQVTDHGKSEVIGDEGSESEQPSIFAIFQMSEDFRRERLSERQRRHSAVQLQSGSECQRHEMYVNLTGMYNGWIVAPEGYNAYYCAGDCPLNNLISNSTKHAYFQYLMSIANSIIPKPCCVPTRLSSKSVLYKVNSTETAAKEDWTNMVVEECGCR